MALDEPSHSKEGGESMKKRSKARTAGFHGEFLIKGEEKMDGNLLPLLVSSKRRI